MISGMQEKYHQTCEKAGKYNQNQEKNAVNRKQLCDDPDIRMINHRFKSIIFKIFKDIKENAILKDKTKQNNNKKQNKKTGIYSIM